MLNDDSLRNLNSLVNDALAAGVAPKKALALLTDELTHGPYVVRRDELVFDTSESERAIPGHTLLGSWVLAQYPLRKVYRDLSGAGASYNGMWGDGSMLRDEQAASHLIGPDREPMTICEQVVLCIRLLGTSTISLPREIAEATRRHLSELLLTYPVLLHPAIMAPANLADQRPEYGSLVYLLAKTPHGGLPRYSHFEADDGSLPLHRMPNQDLVKRLTAFAKHPCVEAGLTRAATRACLNKEQNAILIGKETVLAAMASVMGPKPQFLAAVMELEELAKPLGPNMTRALPFHKAIATAPKSATRDPSALKPAQEWVEYGLMNAVAAASGLVHLVTSMDTLPTSIRTYAHDPRLLASVRARMPVLCGLDKAGSYFGTQVRGAMMRKVFLRQAGGLGPEELAQNARRMALGLVGCGFCSTPQEAAGFIATTVLGHDRPGLNLPPKDTAGAVAFLKAIDEMGGFNPGAPEAEHAIDGMKRIRGAVRDFPARDELPYRAEWDAAFQVVIAEKVMASVLQRPVASNDEVHDSPSAPVRRARAAI